LGDGMKLITFMRMLVDYEKIGYEITSNREVIVVYGEKGKLVIPFADIYSWKTGELRRKIRELKPKQKSDGDNYDAGGEYTDGSPEGSQVQVN